MIETSPEALKDINNIIQNFIWERKAAQIEHFLGTFLFLLNQSFICHSSQVSSLFTILQEHMSL